MTMNQTAAPFAELVADAGDTYDLSVWMHFTVDRYPNGAVADGATTSRDYCIEASRSRGAWHVRVSPWNGDLAGDDVLSGPPVVDLRDQTDGPDPLTLLRALLTGGNSRND